MKKYHLIVIPIIVIAIILIISSVIITKNINKDDPSKLTEIPDNSLGSCSSFNAGFRVMNLEYVNSLGITKSKPVAVWYPSNSEEKPFQYDKMNLGDNSYNSNVSDCGEFPLVIYSHGYGGCGIQSIFFTEELARKGYIVIAPDHDDAQCSSNPGGEPLSDKFSLSVFMQPEIWNSSFFFDRKEDINFLLDETLSENKNPSSFLYGKIDEDRIGMAGHSLGGYTALSLVGGWPDWKDARIKAALLHSPFVQAHVLHSDFNIDVPVMIHGGELESRKDNEMETAYNRLSSEKYLIFVDYAGHLAWSNLVCLGSPVKECLAENKRARAINYYSINFFDKHLKGSEVADQNLKVRDDLLSTYIYT